MKITVYTIKDCAFSKQEKEYLNTNKLVFEEKDLETNKDFLTEMLAISNNFAGTPVTRVEKDDGTISVLKGFTKEEFDTTFGFSVPPAPVAATPKDQPTKPSDVTAVEVPPAVEADQPSTQTVAPTPVSAPAETTDKVPTSSLDLSATKDASTVADSLQSVMDSLQSKSQDTKPADSEPTPTAPPVTEQPITTPTTMNQTGPAIPDFPTK
jgi:glutaredoxin